MMPTALGSIVPTETLLRTICISQRLARLYEVELPRDRVSVEA
jgi:hypothetical protein